MHTAAFVERMLKAIDIAKAKGAVLNAEAVIAQAALESAWGGSLLAKIHNNLFGMKAGTLWKGPTVDMRTAEYYDGRYHTIIAKWRVYSSWNECLVDYSTFIRERRWFKDALPHADPPHGDGNARAWISKLVDSDYPGEYRWATGPDYVAKVIDRVGKEVSRIRGVLAASQLRSSN